MDGFDGLRNDDIFSRERMLVGNAGLSKLKNARVAVFGLGGVGGAAAEALVRAGVGELILVDNDVVNASNLNRQIIATVKTVGMRKVDAAEERFLSINPALRVRKIGEFFCKETLPCFDFGTFDFVCDAIDSVDEKILLIKTCSEKKIPIISSMGTGNKLSPEKFEIADINKTCYCPLARTVRQRLRQEHVDKLTVVYSREEPVKTGVRLPGSISFVPPAAGLLMASYIVKELIGD